MEDMNVHHRILIAFGLLFGVDWWIYRDPIKYYRPALTTGVDFLDQSVALLHAIASPTAGFVVAGMFLLPTILTLLADPV